MLLLPREILDSVEPCACESLQSLVAVVVHKHLPIGATETEIVGDYERVHEIVFRKIGVGFLEFPHLLGVEDMNFRSEASEVSVLAKRVDEMIAVNGSRFQPDGNTGKMETIEGGNDTARQDFDAAGIVLDGKAAVLAAVRLHQVGDVGPAAHVNANEKRVHGESPPSYGFVDSRL